ncbi:hypothetical protein GGF32_008782 [Allomyces javanicus]|nr:hypothetical protein GGF32_008782 [Allomyces javanicus]
MSKRSSCQYLTVRHYLMWLHGEKTKKVMLKRTQFPIELGYALMAHKAQGMMILCVLMNLADPLCGPASKGVLYMMGLSVAALRRFHVEVIGVTKKDLYLASFLSRVPHLEDLSLVFQGLGQHQTKAEILTAIPRNNLKRLRLYTSMTRKALRSLLTAPFPKLTHLRVDEYIAVYPTVLAFLAADFVATVEVVLDDVPRVPVRVPEMLAAIFRSAPRLGMLRILFPTDMDPPPVTFDMRSDFGSHRPGICAIAARVDVA